MKITIYTVSDCKFSQQEKEYLTSKGMQFEEKNLETNRDFLTEMLAKSNNFAGTPVTEIVKDDGTSMIIKGFTQSEFDAALSTSTVAATPAQDPSQQAPQQPVESPMPPAQPVTEPTVPPMPTPPAEEPSMPPVNEAASAMNVPDPAPVADPTPAPAPEPIDTPQTPTTNPEPAQTPAMPDVGAGQILSDTTPAPMSTPSMLDTSAPSFSAEPQGGPVVDPAVNTAAPAPAQTAQGSDPLGSVLSNLQAKANS